jgi:hypothetical protein
VNDRNTIGIIDDADLQRCSVRRRSNEHRHVRIIGLEPSPVVSECMEHVVIGDTVLAGARLDVHLFRLRIQMACVNIR